jgi:hypothetical protein
MPKIKAQVPQRATTKNNNQKQQHQKTLDKSTKNKAGCRD